MAEITTQDLQNDMERFQREEGRDNSNYDRLKKLGLTGLTLAAGGCGDQSAGGLVIHCIDGTLLGAGASLLATLTATTKTAGEFLSDPSKKTTRKAIWYGGPIGGLILGILYHTA